FLIARALVPHLVRRGSGHVVTIGSVSDHVPYTGSTAHAATKYELPALHEALRSELPRNGLRTTPVPPTHVTPDPSDPMPPPATPPPTAFRAPHCSPCWPWLHSAPPPPRRSRPCPTRPVSASTCSRSPGRPTARSGSGPTARGSMSCGRARRPGSTSARARIL